MNVPSRADNFSQFGGTLPRRSDVSGASNPTTAASHHYQSRNGGHERGTNATHASNQQHNVGPLSSSSAHHATATVDRRLQGGGGGGGASHTKHGQHSSALGKTLPFGGSCNNLIENYHNTQQQQFNNNHHGGGGGGGKAANNSHHNGGGHGGYGNDAIVTVHQQPQTHWSHQHIVPAAAAAVAAAIAVGSPKSATATAPKDMDDLIHLPGPLTEDAVMRTLQARFADGNHFVRIQTRSRIHNKKPRRVHAIYTTRRMYAARVRVIAHSCNAMMITRYT